MTAKTTEPPVPSKSASVLDCDEHEDVTLMSQEDFIKEAAIDRSKQIKLVKLLFMRYQHPDPAKIDVFLQDFGFFKCKETEKDAWYRGYGPDAYVYHVVKGPKKFLGGAFEVESYEDLEKALQIPGAEFLTKGIESLDDAPGGGHIVTVVDPEGFPFNLVYGQTPVESLDFPPKIPVNDETEKPRTRHFLRFMPGPAAVHKAGHYGLVVKDLATAVDFYTRNFNLMPTNYMCIEEGDKKTKVGMFAHVDRGEEMVDHHSLFIATLPPGQTKTHPHHCSFEVHDINSQALGHDWLRKQGYELVWGIGRHVLGSQIFDYWWDTTGNMVEHYIDGDLVNKDTPISSHLTKHAVAAAWGPDLPAAFMN